MFCCPVQVEALRWADPASKEPYQTGIIFMLSEIISEVEQARGPNLQS
jgi:hypothetical protein